MLTDVVVLEEEWSSILVSRLRMEAIELERRKEMEASQGTDEEEEDPRQQMPALFDMPIGVPLGSKRAKRPNSKCINTE